ncbi:MAG: outer membrane lipoprotein-sorting protein [Alphaproteobacteria bacterium]|nr:outer membrane lipoprotein-sorting protein [Alphaproteobacteria bacterium]MCB9700014.1 outer membrane lipoprotein-sorting protein [Alphaproteobacteria bacterium]
MMMLLLAAMAWAADPTIEELLLATDDAGRGDQSVAVIQMHVKTDRYERTMKMQAWAKGTERTLVRILEPAKDAGVTTLKVDDNLWNYLPKVDRTMKVPPGMMSGSWMGSHFSNDDLVKESRLSEDFTCEITGRPDDSGGNYVVSCVPKPEAPVVWGKVAATVTPDKVPVKVEYWDEKGELVRTMDYSDVRDVGNGRKMPFHMMLTPHDKPGEFTELTFESLDLTVQLDDGFFNLQSLQQR